MARCNIEMRGYEKAFDLPKLKVCANYKQLKGKKKIYYGVNEMDVFI